MISSRKRAAVIFAPALGAAALAAILLAGLACSGGAKKDAQAPVPVAPNEPAAPATPSAPADQGKTEPGKK